MWIRYNPNPYNNNAEDCVVRAIAKAFNTDWYEAYDMVCKQGRTMADMPNANSVWGVLLMQRGFRRYAIPETCPDCYTIRDFCIDNPYGIFILGTGTHAVCVIDGDYYDAFDSGDKVPIYYYFYRKE